MDPRSMDHLCGPSPWSPALCEPSPRTNPVDHPKFLKTNFYLRSKRILGTLNGRKLCHFILSGSKASHDMLAQNFPEYNFHRWVRFNLEGETIFQDL